MINHLLFHSVAPRALISNLFTVHDPSKMAVTPVFVIALHFFRSILDLPTNGNASKFDSPRCFPLIFDG